MISNILYCILISLSIPLSAITLHRTAQNGEVITLIHSLHFTCHVIVTKMEGVRTAVHRKQERGKGAVGWKEYLEQSCTGCKNFVLLGEAGSGKSELALELAVHLAQCQPLPVHFFDLDMTKPLFRSRDLAQEMEALGIVFHYEKQFMDAPTQVGGVMRLLRDEDCCVVMDVGGDANGARAVGGYAPALGTGKTAIYYIVNSYRPWSCDIDHIDGTLSRILQVSHLRLENLRFVANPNNGAFTTQQEFEEGLLKTRQMLEPYCRLEFAAVSDALYADMAEPNELPVLPLALRLTYPWLREEDPRAER